MQFSPQITSHNDADLKFHLWALGLKNELVSLMHFLHNCVASVIHIDVIFCNNKCFRILRENDFILHSIEMYQNRPIIIFSFIKIYPK